MPEPTIRWTDRYAADSPPSANFASLDLVDGSHVRGPWTLIHYGFGNMAFEDRNGTMIPMPSVLRALR